jgi:TPR repeat protein
MRRAPLNLTLAALFGAVPIWPQDAPGKSVFTESQRNALCDTARKLKPEDAPALRHKAEAGDVDAQLILALAYGQGYGVSKSNEKALEWYRKAAAQNHPMGQNSVGQAYVYGWGVNKDPTEAVRWTRLAAEQGLSSAQANLARFYSDGVGVPRDDKLAAEWAAKAADQGNASGQTLLGWAYNEGKGVRKDAETAVKYFRLAAEQGASGAAVNLGMAYRDGKGFPKTAIKRFTGLKKRRKARWCSRPTMFPSCTTGTDGSTTITIL